MMRSQHHFVALLWSGLAHVHATMLPTVDPDGTLNVGIVIMPGIFISEATIPFDVFKHVADNKMNTFFVAESMDPVTTYYGTKLKPHFTFTSAPSLDVLVQPSGIGSHWSFLTSWYGGTADANGVITGATTNGVAAKYYGNVTALIDYVRTASASAQIVTSHCWGAFTLADAGVLDGQTVTTFPGYTETLQTHYPAIAAVVSDQRMVVSGKVLTSNGGLAAFEACLYLVRHIYGDVTAKKVADALVFSPNNEGHSKLEYYKVSPAKEGDAPADAENINVAILMLDGAFISEPVGPFDVFAHMGAKMKVFFVAEDMNSKTTYYGAEMYPDYHFGSPDIPRIDLLVVPSGIGSHWSFLNAWYGGKTGNDSIIKGVTTNNVSVTYYGNSTATINWVKAAAASARYVTSHCWGAFTLADAGILDGKTATTFPGYTDELKLHYPAIGAVVDDNRIVQDGKVITSNGGVAAYEAANYVVKLIYGEYYAKNVASALVFAEDNYNAVSSAMLVTTTTPTPTGPTEAGGARREFTSSIAALACVVALGFFRN